MIMFAASFVVNGSLYDVPLYFHSSCNLQQAIFTYFFNLASASAKALFLKPSSCFFKYLLTSFLETLCFFSLCFLSLNVDSFSRWPHLQVNICPLPSPPISIRLLQFVHLEFVRFVLFFLLPK